MKPAPSISLIPYSPHHQPGIDSMMQRIAAEFDEPISLPSSQIPAFMKKLPDPYWVAVNGDEVIGTAGIALLQNGGVALRRMFVDQAHRGTGVSSLLLSTAFGWSEQNKHTAMYLGTMAQFKAAQRFYEKNGFTRISRNELPADFPLNPIDAVFYKQVF